MYDQLLVNMMILKLVLELLHLIPELEEQIKACLVELHSSDSTGKKVANIATITAVIAGSAASVVDTVTTQEKKPGT